MRPYRSDVERPTGAQIDNDGIAKGLLADEAAAGMASFPAFAVDCCGDARIAGTAGSRGRSGYPLLVEEFPLIQSDPVRPGIT